jgi:hypothetical protein
MVLGLLASSQIAMAAGTGQVNGSVSLKGHVTNQICTLGTVNANDSIFNVGVLVDTGTGYLSSNLAVPPKILSGSFCNTKSVISIVATPMKAQDVGASAPSGFSQAVDYTATASGWTTTPAAYTTSAAANPGASQIRPTAFSGDITVSLSNFATTGGNTLRLVSDPLYQGIVTITLAASS